MTDLSPLRAPHRRLAALASLAALVAVLIMTIADVASSPWMFVMRGLLLLVLAASLWYAATRAGRTRVAPSLVALVVAAVLALSVARDEGDVVITLVLRLALLLVAVGFARFALGRDTSTLKAQATPGTPVPAAAKGVLIINPRSGGGKAARSHLAEACASRGIEAIVLHPEDDLRQVAHDAVHRGADVLGVAGGDGSQALVADVAAEHDIAMVVIPAGTRNHLALDLGLDREDVVGGLDAFAAAVERTIDLGEVNGIVFVNNVSLGLYAAVVRSPDYRDAKVDTTLAALPRLLGPEAQPYELHFIGPEETHFDAVHFLQIANNPYGTTIDGLGTRPALDTGEFGIYALVLTDDLAAARFLAALATGDPQRYEGFRAWQARTFEVTGPSPLALGVDGESLELPSPLRFSLRPQALRVRLPKHAIGYSPAARALKLSSVLVELAKTAAGRPESVAPRPSR